MKLILWLEEEKIRLYEKIDRAPLRKFDKSWYEAVGKYAKELGVPADGFTEKAAAVKLNVLSLGLGGPYWARFRDLYRIRSRGQSYAIR